MKSLRPASWKWQWTLVLLVLTLGSLAILEPESAEAAKSMATVSAMLAVGWFVWHLMNHE
ncbi:MAG TPA: hypothetical protein VH299_03515 [Solirubrobacterales bacterium]|jgi:hypothetical protein|nr:hypothetical protein [Solirubrobacterales bacterium]